MKKRLATMMTLLLVIALVLSACAPKANPVQGGNENTPELSKDASEYIGAKDPSKLPEGPKNRKDTIIIGTVAPEGSLNPIYTGTLYDSYVTALVFDGMISNDAEGNPTSNVAEKWDISEDGKTYTFYLKKGIKFTNGEELTAEDVAFTYTSMCDPNYDGPRIDAVEKIEGYKEYNGDVEKDGEGKSTGKVLNEVKEVSGIKVIDPHTISFTLTEVKAPAIYDFGYGIMSKKYYGFEKGNTKKLKDLFLKPMGSGAYVMKEYKPGQEVVFVANENYWKGQPKIKNLIMKVTNATTAVQELSTGGVDVDLMSARPENREMIEKAGFLDMSIYLANSYNYIGLNLRDPMFSDKKVRQALAYGLNRQAAVDAFYKGSAEVCNQPFSPLSWAASDDVNIYAYDVEKAKKLLDEAGWALGNDGFRYKDGKKFTIHWMTSTGSKWVEMLIPIVKDNWKQLGVEVIPELMEFGTLCEKVYDMQEFEMYNMGWSLSIDPDPSGIFSMSQDVLGGNNCVGWRNEESEKLMQDGLVTVDQEKRKEIYQKWAKLANDELPYIFLAQSKDMVVISSRVKGMNPSAYIDWTYDIHLVEIAQ